MRSPSKVFQGALGRIQQAKADKWSNVDRWESSTCSPESSDCEISSNGSSSDLPRKDGVILFDWDDTLCPTWFIKNVHMEVHTKGEYGAELHQRWGPYCRNLLDEHTRVVCDVLRAASKVGHVGIVTLGNKIWVKQVLRDFMSGQGLEELLKELKIDFYFANLPRQPERGMPAGVAGKMETFKRAISAMHDGEIMNVTSIGDSNFERVALQNVMADTAFSGSNGVCKTVKLPSNPDIGSLTKDLRLLLEQLPAIVTRQESFDCDFPLLALPPVKDAEKESSSTPSSIRSNLPSTTGKLGRLAALVLPKSLTRRRQA
jgi:hypothetical protein